MDRSRVVRTVEALLFLALDQRGKPEGDTALSRANDWIARHGITCSHLSSRANDAARRLGIATGADFCSRSTEPPSPPQSRPPFQRHAVHRPYVDYGTCAWCGASFARGKWHAGGGAQYCSPTCHQDKRRADAKERMRRARAR